MADVLPNGYAGDSYSFRLTLPDASYLAGAPGNVKAQVRRTPTGDVAATWTVQVDGSALVLSLAADALPAGQYVTDVQIGTTTYLKMTRFTIDQDVSR